MLVAFRVLLLFVLIAISGVQPAGAREDADVPVPPEQLPCTLVVRAENGSFPAPPAARDGVAQIPSGGSLTLHFDLTWSGDQPVTILWGPDAYESLVRLSIKTPLGTNLETSHNASELRPEQARQKYIVTLEPGETVTGHCAVGVFRPGPQFFRFTEPGLYELAAAVEIHIASGDPTVAAAWQSVGHVSANSVQFAVVPRDDEQFDVRLVRGQVTDADGAPVPGADVYVHIERVNRSGFQMKKEFIAHDRAVTDDEGRYAFPGFPASEPRLMLGVVHRALPPAQQIVAPDSGTNVQDVDFQLGRARVVTGTIVDADGRPLPGVLVRQPSLPGLRSPGWVQTDVDGRFEIQGVTTEAVLIPTQNRDWQIVDESNALSAGDGPATMKIAMRPYSRESLPTLTGTARFENGEPARNMELTLYIDRDHQEPRSVRGKTGSDGRFSIDLQSDFAGVTGPFSGIAELAKERDQQAAQDRGMARFAIPAADSEIELEIRREHSLTVNLTSANPLPEALGVKVDVSAHPSHGSSRIASQMRRGDRLTPLTVRNLTAGRYQVQIEFEGVSHYRQFQDVTIPFDEPGKDREVTLNIPEFHFGSVRVEVRLPDGRKPADGFTVEMYGSRMSGFTPVVNGVATYPAVPAGPVTVHCNERDGIVGFPVRGRVEAGRETTLGPLVLRTVDEAYGHVAGFVTLADGRPALGAVVDLDNVVSPSAYTPGGREQVNGSGGFRVSAAPDTEFISVHLKDCDLWPPGSVAETATPGAELFVPGYDPWAINARSRIIVCPVELTAGQEQLLNFTLPDVPFRDVAVEVADGRHAHVRLWTDLDGTWMYMEADVGGGKPHTFRHVPDRPTRLMVSAWDTIDRDHARHLGAEIIDVPAGVSPVIRCDLSQTVPLRIRSKTLDGPGRPVAYQVRPFDVNLPSRVSALARVGGESYERTVDEHGIVTFRLAPGKYVVTARRDWDEPEQSVEVQLDAAQDVEFDFTNGE